MNHILVYNKEFTKSRVAPILKNLYENKIDDMKELRKKWNEYSAISESSRKEFVMTIIQAINEEKIKSSTRYFQYEKYK